MAESTEDHLIARVIAGDESAFRILFRQHSGAMFAVALRLLGRRRADAEDAVQEAWLRAIRSLATFRKESTLRTWLIGIAVRCSLESCRRRGPVAFDDDAARVDEPAIAPVDCLDLDRAIAALADGYRHVLVLHDVHGYTHAEIASLLGIDEGTSKSQLSRGRALVRRALSGAQEK
jgi:RNA polymerase sigma-70 factor (ECF subfamily)